MTVVAFLVASGIAYATIPDSSGVIHRCYDKGGGGLRVIDSSSEACNAKKETALTWNVQGPAGPAGPKGDTGATGPAGLTDTTADAFVGRFGTDTGNAVAGNGATCTLGEILLTAGSIANGIPADGRLLQIAENITLFQLIGTTYGGDGLKTFALPDLRAEAPNHMTYSICVGGVFPTS